MLRILFSQRKKKLYSISAYEIRLDLMSFWDKVKKVTRFAEEYVHSDFIIYNSMEENARGEKK